MAFQIYIKRFCFIVIGIFLLSSCGLIGGDDKVDVSENSVLSGPPLAIPPEFDIDLQNQNQQQSIPNYDIGTFDDEGNISDFENEPAYESSDNENIFSDEIPSTTNIENNGEIQSFESFNPNLVRSNKQTNVKVSPKIQRKYKTTVPSDSYNFNRTLTTNQTSYAKKENNFVGFGDSNFEQIETLNTKGLSKEEEFLLEDIINKSDISKDIQDFSTKGDSD
tara:strand:+ start:242 stop:904 length:663 start_codon:yes stop_codon:yes gene_type:complete